MHQETTTLLLPSHCRPRTRKMFVELKRGGMQQQQILFRNASWHHNEDAVNPSSELEKRKWRFTDECLKVVANRVTMMLPRS